MSLYDPDVDASPRASTGRGEPMRCPSCNSRLVEVERSDVLIDACPSCRGVWLDRGELDKILVRERELAAGGGADEDFLAEVEGRRGPEPRPHAGREGYGDHERGYGKHGRRKRRGLLEELLDFD
jgi:Zn-finger nucleic acid-binding protein